MEYSVRSTEVCQERIEGNSGALVAYNNYVSMLRVSIWLNKWRRGAQPNSTEHKLDNGADGNYVVRCSWYHYPPYQSPCNSYLESQNHSNSFGQDCGESYHEQNYKCALLQDTGGCVRTANEEQWTEKTEGQSDDQDVSENLIVGLDNGSVVVLHKNTRISAVSVEKPRTK